MKRSLKRIFSFWAAVLMMLNIVIPTGSLADAAEGDASAQFQTIIPVALPDGALSPASILGPGVEYGVIAEKYIQKGQRLRL